MMRLPPSSAAYATVLLIIALSVGVTVAKTKLSIEIHGLRLELERN